MEKVNDRTYLYRLGHSETDPADSVKPAVSAAAAAALTVSLRASGVKSEPVFRRIYMCRPGGPLSSQAVGLIVKRRAEFAGVDGDFGAHSLRLGFATEPDRQSAPLKDAMALLGRAPLVTTIGDNWNIR